MAIWNKLTRIGSAGEKQPYQIERLVDARVREPDEASEGGQHIICDIDKTYLETEFESITRMVRIAFEAATDKVTVSGASDVLQRARWGDFDSPMPQAGAPGGPFPRPLHFVSSSPPQLRNVLEEKLMLDGLDWTSDTFKNQAYNIRMGRMDLLRQHVGYKSLAILQRIRAAGQGSRFYMIGDNAETDAFIYLGIKLFLDGRLSLDGYSEYLAAAGVEEPLIAGVRLRLQSDGDRFKNGASVEAILIRNVPGYNFATAEPLTDAVQTFDNFYQAALLLMSHGVIAPSGLWDLTRRFHNQHGHSQKQLWTELRTQRLLEPEGSEMWRAVTEVSRRIGLIGDDDEARRDAVELKPRRLERFQELGSDAIIRLARSWMQRIHAERAK